MLFRSYIMRIKLSDIKNKSSERPTGYYEDVIGRGTIDGDYLIIDAENYTALITKYNDAGSYTPTCNSCKPKLPPLSAQIRNITNSAIKAGQALLQNKELLATEAQYDDRLNICKTCEYFRADINRCSKCGCKTQYKLKLKTESCPVNKWGKLL